jgi:hypothetical protein
MAQVFLIITGSAGLYDRASLWLLSAFPAFHWLLAMPFRPV